MFKVEAKEIFPVKGDADFKVLIKTPSFMEFQEASIEANTHVSVGGPTGSATPSVSKFTEKLIKSCVLKVIGLVVLDEVIDTADKFFEKAPAFLVGVVLEEIIKLATPSEAERKN